MPISRNVVGNDLGRVDRLAATHPAPAFFQIAPGKYFAQRRGCSYNEPFIAQQFHNHITGGLKNIE
jgi:hypothetical protein